MNRTHFLFTVGLIGHAALLAQTQPGVPAFQSFGGGRGLAAQPFPRTETGKPFSATVTTQTTQTLSDGTHVNQTTTTLQYRDAEGRVRTETNQPGGPSAAQTKIITIRDSVAGVTYRLDPVNKSAVKLSQGGGGAMAGSVIQATGRGRGGSDDTARQATLQRVQESLADLRRQYEEAATLEASRQAQAAGGRGGRRGGGDNAPQPVMPTQATTNNPNELVEDLGTLTVNGVSAHGTRVTTVVPVGAIGNDREFRSVSERWFSSDLNLLVKSVNTDPRFGATTYELTNISRQSPDPSLFQVPADYTLAPNGVR
jgi:hypothetical protein